MLKIAEACRIPSTHVSRREELQGAIQTMLDTPGSYLLDVVAPSQKEIA